MTQLNEEQTLLQNTAREFARAQVYPLALAAMRGGPRGWAAARRRMR